MFTPPTAPSAAPATAGIPMQPAIAHQHGAVRLLVPPTATPKPKHAAPGTAPSIDNSDDTIAGVTLRPSAPTTAPSPAPTNVATAVDPPITTTISSTS